MRTVHSYDVFDTVLTRRIGDPDVVIDLVAERICAGGLAEVSPEVLAAARKRHERRLNRLTGQHWPLDRIYGAVAHALNLEPSVVPDLVAAEENLERELAVAVPGAGDPLAQSRAAGHQVVFVSDTPHSERFLRELLVEHGVARSDELVFTSSSRGATKAQGGLFEAVAAALGHGRQYVHHGDNLLSDVGAARVEGWDGHHIPRASLTRYERLLETGSRDSLRLTSWLAGASRLARLDAVGRGVPAPVADVASGVMAPFLVGWTLWVLGQARVRGLQRLYFVARDGEVMLEAARLLAPTVAPDVELRYLHGSRQPWVLGSCASSDVMLAHWAAGRTDFTARTTLARVGLSPADAHALNPADVLRPDRADEPLSAEGRAEIARLLQVEPLSGHVRGVARGFAERSTAYLRQEGLLDGTPSALVDAGWSGRAAAALDHLVVAAGGRPVPHLFVGLLGSHQEAELRRGVELVPWLFDRQELPRSTAGLHAPNVLIEMFCAGTTGRTTDYALGPDGRMRPVLDRERNDPALEWGLVAMRRTALDVVERLAPRLRPASIHVDGAAWSWELLAAFWSRPTRPEAEAWGAFPGEEEIWPPFMPLAQPITATGMSARIWRGEATMRPNNTWRAGSAVASRHPWRGLLRLRQWREENEPRLRRLPRRLRQELAIRLRR